MPVEHSGYPYVAEPGGRYTPYPPRELNLTAYDAAYVLLAADLRAPLVTFDRALGLAAKEVL